MDAKKKKLKQLGGRVTTVKDFLELTDEDMAVIEARIAIAAAPDAGRTRQAHRLEPGQSGEDGRRRSAGQPRVHDPCAGCDRLPSTREDHATQSRVARSAELAAPVKARRTSHYNLERSQSSQTSARHGRNRNEPKWLCFL
jgi:hypothetical protein